MLAMRQDEQIIPITRDFTYVGSRTYVVKIVVDRWWKSVLYVTMEYSTEYSVRIRICMRTADMLSETRPLRVLPHSVLVSVYKLSSKNKQSSTTEFATTLHRRIPSRLMPLN